VVEPWAGLIGPFDTKEQAIATATDDKAFHVWFREQQMEAVGYYA
jgi:hypothetical protein